jgi:sigma-B regulation protein RsbU (phosphoserine phosphatase)
MNKRRIFIFPAMLVIGVAVAGGAAFFSIQASNELYAYQDQKNLENSVRISIYLNQRLQMVEDVAEANGRALENMPVLTREAITERLEQSLRHAAGRELGIYAMAVALEPDILPGDSEGTMFFARSSKRDEPAIYKNGEYHYFNFPWYCVPKYLKQTIWSEPYFDSGAGEMLMTTCSMPFYRLVDGQKQFAGVATADITLTQLQRFLNTRQEHNFKYMFMVSKFGRLLSSPDISKAMTETIYSIAYDRNKVKMGEQFRRDIEAGVSGVIRIEYPVLGVRKGNLYYVPLAANEWSLVMIHDLKTHQQYTRNITFLSIFVGLGFFGVLMTVTILVSRRLPGKNTKKKVRVT